MSWKKALNYVPGVGLVSYSINEIKKRKGKRPIYNIKDKRDLMDLGKYVVQVGYLTSAIVLKFAIAYYVHQGISKGEWNPLKVIEEYREEKVIKQKEHDLKKENKLEKTIEYDSIKLDSFKIPAKD
jgi:hypothetical protein